MNTKSLINYSKILLAAGVSCLLMQSANATVLFSEAFDYSAGSGLGGQVNPGNSIAWDSGNSGINVMAGNLTYAGLADQGGNMLMVSNATAGSTINTFAPVTSGQIFYSFLLDVVIADGGNNYVTALNPSDGAKPRPNGSTDAINAYVYANGNIGVRTAGASTVTDGALTLGTTYFVVEEYDFTANGGLGGASLWLNPTAGGPMGAATLTLTGNGSVTKINDVGFKAQTSTGAFLVDNLLIGTTWGDVVGVPEPSTLALAVTGIGLMMGMIRRRRS